jgi:5-methylthioadenosine/S-adenosylhomocysteine deaminase
MDRPHLVPAPDPVSAVVYAAKGSDVDTVVIDGKIVVQHCQVLTMDEERIVREARDRAAKLYQRAGVVGGPRWPVV